MAPCGRPARWPATSSARARVGSVTSRNTAVTSNSAKNSSSCSSHDCNSSNPQLSANSRVKIEWKSAASSSFSARFQVSKSCCTATLVLSSLSISSSDASVTACVATPVAAGTGSMVAVGTGVGEGFVGVIGVGGAVCEGTSGIAVSCGRVGCSPPQEVRSKRNMKHNICQGWQLVISRGLVAGQHLSIYRLFSRPFLARWPFRQATGLRNPSRQSNNHRRGFRLPKRVAIRPCSLPDCSAPLGASQHPAICTVFRLSPFLSIPQFYASLVCGCSTSLCIVGFGVNERLVEFAHDLEGVI